MFDALSVSVAHDGGSAVCDEPMVNLEHDWERRNWARWLRCTEQELRHAVESVGPDPDNVRRFLRQAR